jgi:peptidyl-prolyl cis-trans isomerase SurA
MKFKEIIITLTILSSSLFGYSQESQVIDQVVAVVGEKIVLQSDVEGRIAQLQAQNGDLPANARCEIIENLLTEKLLVNQAKLDSVEVTTAQIDAELDRRLRYFIAQFGSKEAFEEFYKKSTLEFKEELRPSIRDLLLAQRMQAEITQNTTITPKEVKEFFKAIPIDSLPYFNAEVILAQVVKYAEINEDVKKMSKDKLIAIKERVSNDEDFATLAILYSEDPGSAKKGGELGFIGRGQLVKEFEAIAFKLKPDEVSDIIETQFGYHIIKMIERRGNEVNVRHILITPKVNPSDLNLAKNKLDSVHNLIRMDSISFEDAAEIYSDHKNSKNNNGLIQNRQDGSTKIPTDQLDPTLAFVIDTLKVGKISAPLFYQSEDGKQGYRIVKFIEKTDPHVANLDNDYPKIKTAALTQKQNKTVASWFKSKTSSTYIKVKEPFLEECPFLQTIVTPTLIPQTEESN